MTITTDGGSPRTTTGADACVEDACRLIEARVIDDGDGVVALADLARAVGARPDPLRRAFVRRLGVTPRQYADTLRRTRLRDELRNGTDVSGALYAAGYGSTSRLYESAHTHLGMTPASYRAGGAGATIGWTIAPSDLGLLLVGATARGLCCILLGETEAGLVADLRAEFPRAELRRDDDALHALVTDVLGRIAGERCDDDIPLDVLGTAFQRRVWEALRRIPYGEVRTYGEVAEAIGSPRAVRAVGTACGANPVAIVVPCHRVVPKSGGVGNYGLGPARKRELLRREGASIVEAGHHTLPGIEAK